jgi:hypothetical protein
VQNKQARGRYGNARDVRKRTSIGLEKNPKKANLPGLFLLFSETNGMCPCRVPLDVDLQRKKGEVTIYGDMPATAYQKNTGRSERENRDRTKL